MKMKIRIYFALAVIFIVYVSFKILEPDIHTTAMINELAHVKREFVEMKPVTFRPLESPEDLNMTSVRESQLLRQYSVDWNFDLRGDLPWAIADRWVTARHVLPDKAPELGAVLRELSQRRITSADVGFKGTQLKLTLILEGGQRVVFKPKRFDRDDIVTGPPYAGEDRHNGEIVAFHLSRLLGFRNTPLAVGRVINLKEEIIPVATKELLATFYTKDDNDCFYGKCLYCRGESTGVCGDGARLEGSIIMWLPEKLQLRIWKHPWSRTYREAVTARWESDLGYCRFVKKAFPSGPRVLDFIEVAIFDYLTGNADRHHYETYSAWEKNSSVIMLDNGKSFGHPFYDEGTILAPLFQCCMVRYETYIRLRELNGGTLSRLLRNLVSYDPIAPVLSKLHFAALDRRLSHVVEMIQDCITKNGQKHPVLVKDEFS